MDRFKLLAVRPGLGQALTAAGTAQTHGCPLPGITPISCITVTERLPAPTPRNRHTQREGPEAISAPAAGAALTSGLLPAKGCQSVCSLSKKFQKRNCCKLSPKSIFPKMHT